MVTSALLVTAFLLATPQEKLPKDDTDASAKKIRELNKERLAALREAADLSRQLTAAGRLRLDEALEDRMSLLRAELDAAEKASERATALAESLKVIRGLEEYATARKEVGQITALPLLRVKARRLEVEAQLEQEKLRAAKATK